MKRTFQAFQDESEISLWDLKIENHYDSISMKGEMDIEKTREGLNRALALKRIVDSVIEEIKRDKNFPFYG